MVTSSLGLRPLGILAVSTPVLALLLTACGGSGGSDGDPVTSPPTPSPSPTGLLIPAEESGLLVEAFLQTLPPNLISEGGDDLSDGETAAPPALGVGSAGFSATYRLEADVDEHDILKYDGIHLAIAPSRSACCFFPEPFSDAPVVVPPPEQGPRAIRILQTNPASAEATEVGQVPIGEADSVEGLYLNGDELTALSSSAWWGYHGDAFSEVAPWAQHSTSVAVYDIADPASSAISWRLDLEGALVSSRLVGDQLLVIGRHFPSIDGFTLSPATDEERSENQVILDGLTDEALLPRIRINGEVVTDALSTSQCLVTDVEHPKASEISGSPVFTTLLSIDLATRTLDDAVCYTASADGVYVTASSLYVAQSVFEEPEVSETIVHRFVYGDEIAYRGSGRMPGRLTSRDQIDFRLSELDEQLRVVTTEFTGDEDDAFDHWVFVLEQDPAAPELREVSRLPNDTRPDELGKPNEDLYGVRFLGERAYLVTFERIDPLYVLDLSDSADPRIAGELELPGFSDLLHPVSDELILGLGDDGNGRTKLELFDVSVITDPRSLASNVLAEDANWSWSEARYDRRAFTYLAGEQIDRFAVPLRAGVETDSGYIESNRLYLFEVDKADGATDTSIANVGVLATDDLPYFGESRYRSVIDQDAVYFLVGESIWTTFWSEASQSFGPF